MIGLWPHAKVRSYGGAASYREAIDWLTGFGVIEDWGCGTSWARQFVAKDDQYVGIDGSWSPWCDKVVDLRKYRSEVPCVLLRHVLEHNTEWRTILANALASFQKRLAIVLFTPWSDAETWTYRSETSAGVEGDGPRHEGRYEARERAGPDAFEVGTNARPLREGLGHAGRLD